MALLERIASDDEWVSEIYSKDTSPDELNVFGSLKQLWDDRRVGDALPAWRDFDFVDFKGWHGWISVDDIIPGPTYESVFRLWGTALTELYEVDYTNCKFSDLLGVHFSEHDQDLLTKMCRTHNLRITYGPVDWNLEDRYRKATRVIFIELPLADDGVTVDRYLNAGAKLS